MPSASLRPDPRRLGTRPWLIKPRRKVCAREAALGPGPRRLSDHPSRLAPRRVQEGRARGPRVPEHRPEGRVCLARVGGGGPS